MLYRIPSSHLGVINFLWHLEVSIWHRASPGPVRFFADIGAAEHRRDVAKQRALSEWFAQSAYREFSERATAREAQGTRASGQTVVGKKPHRPGTISSSVPCKNYSGFIRILRNNILPA